MPRLFRSSGRGLPLSWRAQGLGALRIRTFYLPRSFDRRIYPSPVLSISMILVKESAPSPAALGSTNGLVQFSMCLARAFSPAFVRYVEV
jgi:hypothetical protein